MLGCFHFCLMDDFSHAPTSLPAPWRLRRLAPLLLACVSLWWVQGCKRQDKPWTEGGFPGVVPEKEVRTKVAILVDSTVDPMRVYQLSLLESLIRTRPGMEISRYVAGGNAETQSRQIQDAVAGGAAYVVIFPQDATLAAPALRKALEKGIKVIALTSALPEDAFTAAIYCDEHRLGVMAGDFVVQALKTKAADEGRTLTTGRVVQLRGDEGPGAARRAEGFMEALRREPGIVLVHDAPAGWTGATAPDRIQEAVRLQKPFDVIYAHNDLIAAAASLSVRSTSVELRESMLILGTDAVPGTEGGASQILKGTLDATVYQPPLVDLAWREMQSLMTDSAYKPRKRQPVRPVLITPENAARLQKQPLLAPQTE